MKTFIILSCDNTLEVKRSAKTKHVIIKSSILAGDTQAPSYRNERKLLNHILIVHLVVNAKSC